MQVMWQPPPFEVLWNSRQFGDMYLAQHNRSADTMPQILNCSEYANDDEVQYLTTLLLYHLVERCGGQLQFSVQDVQQMRERLSSKMVQIHLGNEVSLRIIDRLPELR